jgi:hypothetical protein
MKKNIFYSLLLLSLLPFLLLTAFSCKDDVVTPPELQPGRRDYTWTVDTIDAPGDTYYRMWASSPTDVWATSPGYWDKSIAHFDGLRWSTYGINGIIVPSAVYGFAWNSIFITAENGEVWKYDGSWENFALLTKDGRSDIAFNDIWGESSNNFYVFGGYPDTNGYYNNSFIAHYYNNNWLVIDTKGVNGLVAKLFKNSSDNKIYIRTSKAGAGLTYDSTIIYENSQGYFNKIYSSIWTGGQQADISLIDKEVYFILGNQIAKRVNGQFQTFLQVNNPNFYQRIWGRNSKDIFLLMTDGLAHFNGSDIQYLFHFNYVNVTPWTQIYGAALFDKDIFFLTYEPPTHLKYIFHGTLK